MKGMLIGGLLVLLLTDSTIFAQENQVSSKLNEQEIPATKQTKLGLYVTAKQAFEKWKAAPERAKIIDVRTPEEFMFVGHAEMAWNIPFAFVTYEWDEEENTCEMNPNPDFVAHVSELSQPDDLIFVMCRSGGRGAASVNLLAEAGFTNVYNIVDGVQGDKISDRESVFYGKFMKNGWKNSGLPWTYDVNRERMRLPDKKQSSKR